MPAVFIHCSTRRSLYDGNFFLNNPCQMIPVWRKKKFSCKRKILDIRWFPYQIGVCKYQFSCSNLDESEIAMLCFKGNVFSCGGPCDVCGGPFISALIIYLY